MSKEEIFNYFYTNSANLSIRSTVIIMVAGLFISLIIFMTYWATYRGAVAYNLKFNISLVVVLLISIVIMLMISSNIVISLGMVGALSIVRFRTAIKDSRDTVFIFWAIAEGLCVGSQNFKLALITTLFIAVVLLSFHFLPRTENKYLLIIHGQETTIDISAILGGLYQFPLGIQLKAANRDEKYQEMIFEVRVKGEIDYEMIQKLHEIPGIVSAHWILESGDTVG